ncbi:MAG: hypothetical protein V1769_00210 [Thermoplasmatota archaeon]
MNKLKLFAGMLVFGSLWGFSECLIGTWFSDIGLPSGLIMTGLFAMTFLVMSRMIFPYYGMQIGMGLIAGGLRFFNPFGGCHLCSALAIMAEGVIFELIWYGVTNFELENCNTFTNRLSLGIISAYLVYVGGYIITQILTPLSFGQFYMQNLIAMMPQYLARGLPAALIGGITVSVVLSLRNLKLHIKDIYYYPAAIGISGFCWTSIIGYYVAMI